jgi:hypothetical protein
MARHGTVPSDGCQRGLGPHVRARWRICTIIPPIGYIRGSSGEESTGKMSEKLHLYAANPDGGIRWP